MDFARSVKRYLERRGEMSGDTLFRTRLRGDEILLPPREGTPEVVQEPPRTGSAEWTQEPETVGHTDEGLSGKSGGGSELERSTGSPELSPPMRKGYFVEGPIKRTPESEQADLFGEARVIPAASNLLGVDLEALGERVSKCTLC